MTKSQILASKRFRAVNRLLTLQTKENRSQAVLDGLQVAFLFGNFVLSIFRQAEIDTRVLREGNFGNEFAPFDPMSLSLTNAHA